MRREVTVNDMSDDHSHDAAPAQAQPQGRQVNPESIIRTQGAELARVNDNRIFLLALIDDLQAELNAAHVEIASLKERLEQHESADDEAPALASSNGAASGN